MKYFKELDNLESELIVIRQLIDTLDVIIDGIESRNSTAQEDLNALMYIRDALNESPDKVHNEFQKLFNTIGSDSNKTWSDTDAFV